MEVLLRELREGPNGIPESHDTEISGDEITIGSSVEQHIQLLGRTVAGQQAFIRRVGSQLELRSRVGKVRVNGKAVGWAKLRLGDIIEIGSHQLKIAEPPAGFDIAIELLLNEQVDASEFEGAFRTDLIQTWLGKRKAAWLTVVLVVVTGLALPLLAVQMQRQDKPVPAFMPSDAFWSSGALNPAHLQALGERCDACHQKLFQRVQDSACLDCHRTTHDHVTPEHLAMTELDETQRCATCHREHNEPATFLINNDDALCVSCHANSQRDFGKLKVDPVTGFGDTDHPAFKAHLIKPKATRTAGGVAFDWMTQVVAVDKASEESNLKFSHVQHMDPDRVLRTGDSKPLSCADCHQLESDGEHFKPIAMEERCSSCHELTFDPGAPDRQLPHGKPREAILMLQDYFTRKFSDPNAGRQTRERRRLPGQENEEETCTGAPFECAMRSARKEIETQFSRRGCIGCHIVVDTQNVNVLDRFEVYPIRLARDYFPAGRFDHRSHQIQGKLTGDDACLSCHKAKDSEESSDLMLPVMAKCQECHGDEPARDRITVQCVSCHAYHPSSEQIAITESIALTENKTP